MRAIRSLTYLVVSILAACSPTAAMDEQPFPVAVVFAYFGNVHAIHSLCYRYSYGVDGAPKNYEDALYWCETGASQGHPASLTLLAELYYLGNGVKKNLETARAIYEQAASTGFPHAQTVLAQMYWNGEGGPVDHNKAKHYFGLAAEHGYAPAVKAKLQIERAESQAKDSN